MNHSKQNSTIDDQSEIDRQEKTRLNSKNSTQPDFESPVLSYAVIESNSNELDQVIDVLRQFFPKTRVIEYNNQNYSSNVLLSHKQASIESLCNSSFSILSKSSFDSDTCNDPISLNTNPQTFKGKVKDYLQRRYLEQIREHDTRKETFTKSHSANINSFDSSLFPTAHKTSTILKSLSLDLSTGSNPTKSSSIINSESKRGLLQHYSTIDMDDASNDAEQIKPNQNPYEHNENPGNDNDSDHDYDDNGDKKTSKFQQSHLKKQTKTNHNQWHLSIYHSNEHEPEKGTSSFPNSMSLPLTPYSASSDPGPFHSPWFKTPTSSTRFRFPQCQEQLISNAQGSIAQLSTLTQMLCDEPSLFTPVSPRFKTEKHDSFDSKDSSSVPTCQICRQEFDSRQMYLTHYRTHLENSCQHNVSDILESDRNYDHSSNLRNYSCKICSKHFSRSDMLNRHLRLHSGTRPYRCVICNTYFSRSDHLSTHFRTHTGEKPYTCPQCSYTACRRDMITRHIKIHTKQRSERKHATSSFASSNDS